MQKVFTYFTLLFVAASLAQNNSGRIYNPEIPTSLSPIKNTQDPGLPFLNSVKNNENASDKTNRAGINKPEEKGTGTANLNSNTDAESEGEDDGGCDADCDLDLDSDDDGGGCGIEYENEDADKDQYKSLIFSSELDALFTANLSLRENKSYQKEPAACLQDM